MIVVKWNFTFSKDVKLKLKFNLKFKIKCTEFSVRGVLGSWVLGPGSWGPGSWFLGPGLRVPTFRPSWFLSSYVPALLVPGSFLFLRTQANGKCHISSHYLVHCVALNIAALLFVRLSVVWIGKSACMRACMHACAYERFSWSRSNFYFWKQKSTS
jgi:hypothetical protein